MTRLTSLLAYRALVVAAAAATLWLLPWAQLARYWDRPGTLGDGGPQQAFAILLVAACGMSALTLSFEGRANVSLLFLPVTLAWWQLDGSTAHLLAAFASLFGNALRRAPISVSLTGAARQTLAVVAGVLVAAALPVFGQPAAPELAGVVTLDSVLRGGLFTLVASTVDTALDWLERHLAGGGWGELARAGRSDVLTNVLVFPVAVALQGVYLALGYERQGILLGGLLSMLFVARFYTNLQTLHGALRRLHRTVAAEREKLDTLVTHSGEGIFTIDDGLRVSTVNPAMAALLGQAADDLLGQPCAFVCHFEDEHGQRVCPERCPLREAQAEQRPVSKEVVYQSPGQPPKHLLLTYAAVGDPDGPLTLGIGIARDVSAQKETERLREEFVSLITHELRSPLTASTGYLDLLKRMLHQASRSGQLDAPKSLEYLDRIERAERHLLRLVNNLLDLASVERVEVPVDGAQIDLSKIVDDALEGVVPQAAEKGISLRREVPDDVPALWSSDLYVREILSNLVSNAVKYTPDEGSVTVRVAVTPAEATPDSAPVVPEPAAAAAAVASTGHGWVEVAVADTGYGMSEEDQQRLFTRFFRSGQPEIRKERGTGLGLALTKGMAERIGAQLTFHSELGRGSTFTVRFPLAPVPRPAPPTTEPAAV